MNEQPVTMPEYLARLFGSMGKHRLEAAMGLSTVMAISVLYVWIGVRLHLQGGLALSFLRFFAPMMMAVLLFEVAAATWRLYRDQQISITTKQTLLDLEVIERVESEQNLRAHYVSREEHLHERHEAYVKRLTEDIAGLNEQLTRIRAERKE